MLPYKERNCSFFRSTTACLLLLLVCVLVSLQCGSSGVNLKMFAQYLWQQGVCFLTSNCQQEQELTAVIMFDMRLPRTLVAALCGGALSAAGVISQGLFRNPLASPSILGTSAGGSFFAVLAFYFIPALGHWYTLPFAAFLGALLATMCVLSFAKVLATERLLLIGFALNTFFAALTSLFVFLSLQEYHKISAVLHWLLGGFAGIGWQHLQLLILPTMLGLYLGYRLCIQLDVLSLSEDVASSMSVDTSKLRSLAILSISLLVGASIAVAGSLPFIGLMIPHVCRMFYGASHRRLLTKSIVIGMSFTLLTDSVARVAGGVHELNVGIITALLGGIFFLIILTFSSINKLSPS